MASIAGPNTAVPRLRGTRFVPLRTLSSFPGTSGAPC